jgi:hypothetical protein
MSIEKKSLISNRKAVKKSNSTKINTDAQVAKVAAPKLSTHVKLSNPLIHPKLHIR